MVLEAFSESPFEPLANIELEFLTCKNLFLMAITSVRHVSQLQALSVHPSCLRLGEANSSISLLPNPAFLPKVLPRSFVSRPLVMDPFHPPPHESAESARLHLMRSYIDRTGSLRQTDQLFVCYGGSTRGQTVLKTAAGPLASKDN